MKKQRRTLVPVGVLIPGLLALSASASWYCSGWPNPAVGGWLGEAWSELDLGYTHAEYSGSQPINYWVYTWGILKSTWSRDTRENYTGTGNFASTTTVNNEWNDYDYVKGNSSVYQWNGTTWVENAAGKVSVLPF